MSNLKEQIQKVKDQIMQACELQPMVIMYGEKQATLAVFGDFPGEHSDKLRVMFEAGWEIGTNKATFGELKECYFMSEAWLSRVDKDEKEPYQRPSLDPQRVEVVLINQLKNGKTKIATLELKRDSSGKLTDLVEIPEMKQSGVEVESPLLDAFVVGYNKATPKPTRPMATA